VCEKAGWPNARVRGQFDATENTMIPLSINPHVIDLAKRRIERGDPARSLGVDLIGHIDESVFNLPVP
jgi:hypothetical protein